MLFPVAEAYINTTYEIEASFEDTAGSPIDPENITLTITEPDGSVVSKVKADLTNPTVGTWQFRHKLTQSGTYVYSWFAEVTTPPVASVTAPGGIRVFAVPLASNLN